MKLNCRCFYLFILLFTVRFSLITASAQQQYLPLNNSINEIIESQLIRKGDNFHTSIKPYRLNEINKYVNTDSIYRSLNLNVKSKLVRTLFNTDSSELKDGKDYITINFLLAGEGGYDLKNKDKSLETGIGLSLKSDIGKKLSIGGNLIFNNSLYFNYVDSLINISNVIPGEGQAYNSHLGYFYRNLTFYVTYSPSKYFNFELGKGKNFWGDGYRSLLLSDNSNSYPYFKITTTFWKFKYVNLFAKLRNFEAPELGLTEYKERYTAMHYLSWNITKWMNASFFEAVMFKGKDSTGQRGFDINYLNPVVIYRPIEYSLGSPDNVIMGANINFKVLKKNLIYFQLMLDEFKIDHVRKSDGWWANKQAFQIGLKSFDIFGISNLKFQTEYNFIRPFTYSHFDNEQNYAGSNQALAHPLGANVKESVTFLHYRIKRLQFQLKYNYAIYGSDTGKSNYGQNIFKVYLTRSKEFDNFTGQGVKNTLQYAEFNVSYTLNPKSNLLLEAGVINRLHKSAITSRESANFIYFGIKTSFENQYFDF